MNGITPDSQPNKTRRFADGYGIKFLTPWMTTESNGSTPYPCPAPGQKWSEWMEHPDPADPDGADCGSGRYHVMKIVSANYAPLNWWPWFVRYEDMIGESHEKVGVKRLRLRRIRPEALHRMIRWGWCSGANLRSANLRSADLTGVLCAALLFAQHSITPQCGAFAGYKKLGFKPWSGHTKFHTLKRAKSWAQDGAMVPDHDRIARAKAAVQVVA